MKPFSKDQPMFLFYIDSNPLITSWLKEQALSKGHKIYTLSTLKDAGFFLHDLKPDVLVIESEILKNEKEFLIHAQNEYPDLFAISLITIGKEEVTGHFGMELKGHIQKPMNPSEFFEQVQRILNLKQVH